MTDYKKMTDAQINLAVAELRFGIKAVKEEEWEGDIPRLYYTESGEVFVQNPDTISGEWSSYNPARSWGLAGPIAQQNKINIYFSNNNNMAEHCAPSENLAEHYRLGKESIGCIDYDPCRAICIVYLMMNGV